MSSIGRRAFKEAIREIDALSNSNIGSPIDGRTRTRSGRECDKEAEHQRNP